MLYTYRCPECNITFDEIKEIDKRYYADCPTCQTRSPKIITVTCTNMVWQPKWMNNVAPIPVYVESREQLTNICNMMGNYSNHAFSKNKREFVAPVKQEKKEVIRRLRHGQY